ncbi:DgyrCDS453 [Dimorphilus gyrociliatus]|uniref:DgyrCDS453 n=1 Tax=Dimorphilus gyrociliatus TaxID=2664684 RepID=A0A7I8V5W1_9ANNE|nr:DgyrCDS453 [Dimorphilus gyrociliatus]
MPSINSPESDTVEEGESMTVSGLANASVKPTDSSPPVKCARLSQNGSTSTEESKESMWQKTGFVNGKYLNPPTTLARRNFATVERNCLPSEKYLEAKKKLDAIISSSDSSSVTTETKARSLCEIYSNLELEEKALFLNTLSTEYGLNQDQVIHAAQAVLALREKGSGTLLRAEEKLRLTLQPRYQHIFAVVGRLEKGVKFLVDIRADLMDLIQARSASSTDSEDQTHLRVMSNNIRELLSLWFSVGFLDLERITWQSPCDMLQKISEYEAVHPIRNWTDLKRRVGNYRRCFVFTHASMPREPVVVLHTALTSEISSSIQSIVQRNARLSGEPEPVELSENTHSISTAIFYSITSTQKGLQGVELGNYLIKKVVRELQAEFPNMKNFSSLSPIPGFRDWLLSEIDSFSKTKQKPVLLKREENKLSSLDSKTEPIVTLKHSILQMSDSATWFQNSPNVDVISGILMRLCARYLYIEKRRGLALNPVGQ